MPSIATRRLAPVARTEPASARTPRPAGPTLARVHAGSTEARGEQAARDHVVVVGLGYVGLPLAIALAREARVTGLDIDTGRVAELKAGHDRTREADPEKLAACGIHFTANPADCVGADFYIVTAPTPVDAANRPDLEPLRAASRSVARMIDPRKAPVVVFESTVYPGVTEEVCGPLIEQVSGLVRGRDFFLGYSPERINPGDREHSVERIVKVVAGENPQVCERLAALYGKVTHAGVFRASCIKAAEAAKIIENAQRDINIAFMNEITQIFAKLGLSSREVLEAANTKWNFLPFHPGLVGGHCIGVDPYYLSHCAQSLGHLPRVILSGRAINDGMGSWIADTIHSRRGSRTGDVLMLGLAFKPDVPDIRNSRVADLVQRLTWLGHRVTIHDPLADPAAALHEFGFRVEADALARSYDVVVAAVPHSDYRAMDEAQVIPLVREGGLVADLHGIWLDQQLPGRDRWTL